MHKTTLVSLCGTLDTFITCFLLRALITQHIKMPKSAVHFHVQHEYSFFFKVPFFLKKYHYVCKILR